MTLLQICIVGLLLSAVIELLLLLVQRWKIPSGPRCGGCGYNLTGAPSNRCPECGSLFVEAGIMTRRTQSPRRMLAVVSLASLAAVAGGFAVWQDQQLKAAAAAKAKAVANAAQSQQQAFYQILAEAEAAAERMMIRDLLYRRDQSPERMQFRLIPNYDPSGMWRPR